MDFMPKEEHEIFRDTLRSFIHKEVMPIVEACDEQERFPMELLPRMGELGYLGVGLPEDLLTPELRLQLSQCLGTGAA